MSSDKEKELLDAGRTRDGGNSVEIVPGNGSADDKLAVTPGGSNVGQSKPRSPMDANVYSTKKNVAQGMMDIALLTANASQLKYVLGTQKNTSYYLNVTFISMSLILQVVVGVLLILNSRYNINKMHHQYRADVMNNLIIVGIFLITVVNILAASFNGAG